MVNKSHLIKISNLSISFFSDGREKQIIHNISYQLKPNEILGIVGESGSGKSVSSLAILGLLPKQISKITNGIINFNNQDLTKLSVKEFQKIRGNDIAMIFQEPMSSLNPSMTCGKQVIEILLQHTKLSKAEAKAETKSLFEKVKLPIPNRIYKAYPHEISGGQKQRVMIAMAIACKPKLLIADEPTTALDVTVQKDIIELLKQLQAEENMSILFISHDLALVSEIADRILVMYQGAIVEQGNVSDIFHNPQHTYTKALLSSKPSLDIRLKRLPTIKDFMEGNSITETISSSQRKAIHKQLYSKPPLLEVKNLEKEYLSKPGWFGKPESFLEEVFKARNS